MPPLILHNVPDDELYTGQDGVTRPYAMLFPGNEHPSRSRRMVPETGSFGKSTRRSRSRTGTPAAKAPDPTIAAGDAIFSAYLAQQTSSESPPRKSSLASISQPNLTTGPLAPIDGNAGTSTRYVHKEPTEIILRGFKSTHQYAAIREYECIGGRICEDYPRDPPMEQRRYKADFRDPAALRTQTLMPQEKKKALRFAGGEHWIKVTFESAEAADAALDSSPQIIHGYVIYAEPYRGVPPTADEAIPVGATPGTPRGNNFHSVRASGYQVPAAAARRPSNTLPRAHTTPLYPRLHTSDSPEGSHSSSQTLDSATLSTVTASSATVIAQSHSQQASEQAAESEYCTKLPGAKRIKLLPADQALLPQASRTKRMLTKIPLMSWLSSDIIGTQIPRNDYGEFDWNKASTYWRIVWWIDSITGLFGVVDNEKED